MQGKKIKTLRLSINLSVTELARLAGITQAGLSMIETGRRHGKPETLRKIEKALGLREGFLK